MDLAEVAQRLELEGLYTEYGAALDADRLEDWPEFFTEECHYRVTSAENYEAGLPLGLIYASSKAMLRDRVSALREANIYEPQRYRHLISGIRIGHPASPQLPGQGGAERRDMLDLEANFLVVRTMQDGGMILFAAGRYVDRVLRTDAAWKFASKIVVLDSRQIDTLLAIPL
jgi:3-phenylpropionate/cinnamic acid dioxygenase small subunit